MESTETIYQKYANTVYQYLLSMTHDPDLSEELTQETFYQAIRSIGKYDGSSKITTWLCAIAKNQLLTYRRKNPETVPLEIETDEGTVSVIDQKTSARSVESEFIDEEEKTRVLRILHTKIREPQREILYLRSFGGLSFKEIGEIFSQSENWARVNFYRGKEQLRKEMERDEI